MFAMSDQWHSLGMNMACVSDALVGRPLISILDHLMLAQVGGGVGLTAAEYVFANAYTIVDAANWSW